MSALPLVQVCRGAFASALLLSLVPFSRGQINGVTNPNIGNTTVTLNPADVFLGTTLTVGNATFSGGTLTLSGDYLTTQAFSLTGTNSFLFYSGAVRNLTLTSVASLTRTGAGYTTVFDNLINAGNIVVNQGTLYLSGNLTNSNSVIVSNGAILTAQSASVFINTGTANVTGAGSVLTVLNPTNTSGTIIADSGGLLQLGGNFVTGNLGTINLTNSGSVEITGNLDNTSGNLTGPLGGVYTLNGGTIKNGNIVDTALAQKTGTLDNATVLGNIVIGANNTLAQSLTLQNNATFTGTATVGSDGFTYGTLNLGSNLSTTANSSLVLTGNQSLVNSLNIAGAPFTLTIVPTSSLTRTGTLANTYSSVFTKLNNAGNIVVNQGTLFVNGNFTNTGTANVTGAGSTLSLIKPVNTGTLIADSGGLLQLGGNFATAALGNITISGATLGFVEITGNLDNTGATLTPPTGGGYSLSGIITNGTIIDTALAERSGVLDGATVLGNIGLMGGVNAQSLTLRNGAGFTGTAFIGTAGQNGGTLYLGSALTLAANSTLSVTGLSSNISYNNGQTTLTVVPTSNLLRTGSTGTTQILDHLNNQGNVTVNGGALSAQDIASSANITVAAGTSLSAATGLTQTAGMLKVDGSLFPSTNPGLVVQGGSVTGAGNIQGTTTFSGGTLNPGSTVGTLTFTGNLTLMGGATTNLELAVGANNNDKVVVASANTLTFGGTLNILVLSSIFTSGQQWNVFSFTNHAGSFATINLPNVAQGWVWDTSQLTTTGALTLTTFVPLPVPEPSTYALLAAGLGVMFVAHRRRRER